MKVAILSDIHANLEALEAVFHVLNRYQINRFICLGDLIGYGPDPVKCTEMIFERCDVIVMGNHDGALIDIASSERFNPNARKALEWTESIYPDDLKNKLKSLPFVTVTDPITCVHSTPIAPEQFHYIDSLEQAAAQFEGFTTPLCFMGHSHIPAVFIMQADGSVRYTDADQIDIDPDCRYLINVGSVGQPRDGNPDASVGILDIETGSFHLERIPYWVHQVQSKMKAADLPTYLIQRLSSGL